MLDLEIFSNKILDVRRALQTDRSVLAAITGIDAAGKGYFTAELVKALQAIGVRAAAVNIDGWLNLPKNRFDPSNPAEHFYLHAIRFDDMFTNSFSRCATDVPYAARSITPRKPPWRIGDTSTSMNALT